jgi:nitrite reductase (NADH) small subunit
MQNWINVCRVESIVPDTGVCALVGEEQVAIFRIAATNEVLAISNRDPFSGANVLSRGIIGDKNGVPKVASPVYKQQFLLTTGECLDDPSVKLPVYPVRCENGHVMIGF